MGGWAEGGGAQQRRQRGVELATAPQQPALLQSLHHRALQHRAMATAQELQAPTPEWSTAESQTPPG